tara:strand:- start:2275 stop:2907 length:633 start_codon:yes stop_codon:yes gene_type:complete
MSVKGLTSFNEIAEHSLIFHNLNSRPDWPAMFKNNRPIKLEIGFGNGSFLIEMAVREPENNFVGIDMFHKGIRKLVSKSEKLGLPNLHVVYGDARVQVPMVFHKGQLAEVYINFPDPWPKKKHHKRRLINSEFVDILCEKVKLGGALHLATDYQPYAEEMLACLEGHPSVKNRTVSQSYSSNRSDLPKTKYENNFIGMGSRIFYLDFVRQ